MSTPLICNALGVPLDRWPPDHYALLGLTGREVDAAAVEERVLDRMDRLRRYQLAEPDAVTDAMNRLAQALVCLTDPAAKAAYDASLRPRPAPVPAADEGPAEPYLLAPPEAVSPAPAPKPIPPRHDRDETNRIHYRRVIATRRLLTTWREVGRYVREPGRRLSPPEAIDFVAALLELREHLADDRVPTTVSPGEPGSVVVAFARQPLPFSTFRHLLPDQRSALAADWQAGEARIAEVYSRLNRRKRRSAPERALRKFAYTIATDRFDLVMFVLGLLALGLALLRTR
ncbi:MAG TPA: hypothetical protein VH120_13125 [Gemmataceae bacterium]|nr:hypothetical protein [Gemmataceae bacterium]